MIKNIIKHFVCKIKSHNFIEAGTCPFTGKSYMACLRCEGTIAK
jgi:hypothetical protein